MLIFKLNPGMKVFLSGPCVKPSKLMLFSPPGPSYSAMLTKHLLFRPSDSIIAVRGESGVVNDIRLRDDMAA